MSIIQCNVVEVKLTQGFVAIIDAEDFGLVSQYKWQALRCPNTVYAVRGGGKVLLHRVLLNAPDGMHVDHKNHDGLDNRKTNLRLCTHSENNRNRQKQTGCSSKFKGVSKRNSRPNLWRAQIKINKQIHTRSFATELEAALWYDEMAMEHFGAFAKLNFPKNDTTIIQR